jgi:hypothetical protein
VGPDSGVVDVVVQMPDDKLIGPRLFTYYAGDPPPRARPKQPAKRRIIALVDAALDKSIEDALFEFDSSSS